MATEVAKKLTEASLEDVEDQKAVKTPPDARADPLTQAEVTVGDGASVKSSASKPETAKEEGPQDLRVFELNSDSGKSTPSNNGKKGTVNPIHRIKCCDLVLRLRRCSSVKVTLSSEFVPPPPAGSSTDVSEDWEKDFDLDMTEEEVQMALSKIETSGEVSICFVFFFT